MSIQTKIDKLLPIGGIIRRLPYVIIFKTTNYCWFRCAHCCESAGPDQPRKYMPLDIIYTYLCEAVKDPLYSGHAVFTGGEIMSSYRFGDPAYVPTILKWCLQANIRTDIKTNAGWARTSFGKQIFDDLADVITTHPDNRLQISLSLDKFHTNCMENNLHVLERLAGDKLKVAINMPLFKDSAQMFPELLNRLRARGVRVEELMMLNPKTMGATPVTLLNQSVLVQHRCTTLFDGGRAKNLPQASHTEFPQFKFMDASGMYYMAFDTRGRVTLGENSGRKISTRWKLPFTNRIYCMDAIKKALIQDARYEELRAILFHGWKRVQAH